ncbi:SurA N-terminal domain-containing protein [Nesterenkonia alba]|uniref:SurA N-terminal domain-containing protein n=1 Tax=Nesterenkonia alba TaxID=515814 RepID=UPI0003B76636|nr:SurA N-terminal domain-containing protein [Nesterenkonia alba]
MQKKIITSLALAGLLVGLTACDDTTEDETPEEGTDVEDIEGMGEQEMPEPDLDDVPDVVAEVNGEEISGEDFTAIYESQFMEMTMQAQMTGQQIDEEQLQEQTVDTLVNNELLIQDAQASGYEVTDEEIDEELDTAAETNGMESGEDLIEALEEQGNTEEEILEDVENQVLVNEVLDSLETPEPTEEEIEEAYEEFLAQQAPIEGEDGETEEPSLDEVRDELEDQVAAQHQNEAAMDYLEELRDDADVVVHL